jgi:hypothetical protein
MKSNIVKMIKKTTKVFLFVIIFCNVANAQNPPSGFGIVIADVGSNGGAVVISDNVTPGDNNPALNVIAFNYSGVPLGTPGPVGNFPVSGTVIQTIGQYGVGITLTNLSTQNVIPWNQQANYQRTLRIECYSSILNLSLPPQGQVGWGINYSGRVYDYTDGQINMYSNSVTCSLLPVNQTSYVTLGAANAGSYIGPTPNFPQNNWGFQPFSASNSGTTSILGQRAMFVWQCNVGRWDGVDLPNSIEFTIGTQDSIPTLTQWGIIIFTFLLLIVAVVFIRRKQVLRHS